MAISIITDTFEPFEIAEEMKKSIPVSTSRLQPLGMCDYLWWAYDNHTITVERKTVSDLAGRVDALERQLKTALKHADEVILLIEGVSEPIGNDTVLYQQKKDGSIFYKSRVVNRSYKYFMGFIWRLDKLGISTFSTATKRGTAEALVEFVQASNKEEYTTFKRYIREKPYIPNLNPQVQTLVSLGMGIKTSELLIAKFKTAWKTMNATSKQICTIRGLGESTVEKLNKLIGREHGI